MRLRWLSILFVLTSAARAIGAEATITELSVVTGVAELRGPSARQQLVAVGKADGRAVDLTRKARWRSETPGLVAVGADGVARALGDGEARISAEVAGRTAG